MPRYIPTEKEKQELIAKGWQIDSDGWCWRIGTYGYGKTYKQAIKEQEKIEREAGKSARHSQ